MNNTSKLNSAARNAFILWLLFFLSGMAYADSCTDWIAKLDSFQGKVQTKRAGSVDWKEVSKKDAFCAGDMLRVMEKSRAVIVLKNETVTRLDQNTTITLAAATKQKPTLLELLKGAAYFISRTPQKFRINTPFLNAGIEGTEFLVSVLENEASVSVFEGAVLAENSFGSLMLAAGQTATAEAGKAPVLKVVARPKDAVQWTLYYPRIASTGEAGWQKEASELLAVGRVDEAGLVLERVLKQESANSSALALQAVIAIAQNDREKARDLASRAVDVSPNSASARLALSYAQQAAFDLKGALSSVRTATEKEPANALAWARLSELHLSQGEKRDSLAASDKAVSLAPGLSRTQTVHGFAHLSQIKTDEATAAFEKAAGLDPADPLPRLGLGLAKIRKGQLEEGRREIEIAVSLDTNNALIRSYLGKAYYEEKRNNVAADQFSMAEASDPKDPTAFFYSALQKQSENRPVEALQDIEKSMALNDNRAVYRSRLLLDEDQAARGASLARIYNDLGFQQLALSEGYKSVNADPANASAHRFLSDSYAALPRHEIARVSELLQAQLLQPVGLNPVQPHLAESGLFILQGAGPADAGFNEYNPLFSRNRVSLLMSGVVGSNNTFGDEVVVSGLHEKLAFSVGQFHYETDGFRKNNDQKKDIYNAFAQVSLSHDTSVQLEFRATNEVKGDLPLRFDPENYFPKNREEKEAQSARIGVHHSLAPGSDLIASLIYMYSKTFNHSVIPVVDFSIDDRSRNSSWSGEIQHLLRLPHLEVTSGAGYLGTHTRSESAMQNPFPPPDEFLSAEESTVTHTNGYVYANVSHLKNFIATVGASADFFKHGIMDREQLNPKFGLVWTGLPDTTLRAAVFRTLNRNPLRSQTIEPTQVAGFNQFFDESEGVKAWRAGIGIDHKFTSTLFAGVEYSGRRLDVPFLAVDLSSMSLEVMEVAWTEKMGRAYLNWTPSKRFALSAEYIFESFWRDKEFGGVEGIHILRTHRVPLGISYAHPSGLSSNLKATYVYQKGEFQDPIFDIVTEGKDHFWIVDASLSYRFPKQMGGISIEARNLFDKKVNFQDTDPASPIIQPRRAVFFKLTLSI